MAKLLLCCDEYIYHHNGIYYFKNQEWSNFFYRYLRVFEEIKLITRCKHEDSIGKDFVPINLKEIDYVPLPFFQGPIQYAKQYLNIGRIIRNSIEGCDCAILRLPFAVSERLGKQLIHNNFPYALEIVFDAEDAWKNASSFIDKFLWKKIDNNLKLLSSKANGISCVTEFYLQKHYYSYNPNTFSSHYSSLSLNRSFYSKIRNYPYKTIFTIANVALQVQYKGRKGHVEIIKAINLLKKQGIIVNAKFVGEDYNDGIRKLSELATKLDVINQVEFLGYLPKNELSIIMDDTDIYVMPTKAEGLPRVIIEAMAKGLPCITTNVSGNSELIDKHYLIENYYDINTLAERIKELITKKESYELASKANFENSLKYDSEILQDRRDYFYTQLKEVSFKKK